jgi:hypothetical protein
LLHWHAKAHNVAEVAQAFGVHVIGAEGVGDEQRLVEHVARMIENPS